MTTHLAPSTRLLGRDGPPISTLGLGAWAIGGPWTRGWGPQDDDQSIAAIHRAVELGVAWIDTAPVYGRGHSEAVVGRALALLPAADRPLVFTKCGRVETDEGPRSIGAPAMIRGECEASLRRLGVECLDLLQLHWPPEDGTTIEEAWAAMVALCDAGKARRIGVSNVTVDQLAALEAVRHVDTLQPPLSLVDRRALDGLLPWCVAHGTAAIVYSPMQSGLLSGAFDAARVAALDPGDWRRTALEFTAPRLERNLALVAALAPVAADVGATVAELAIAWALDQPGVTGAIVGARNAAQVDGWIGAGRLTIGSDARAAIRAALAVTGAGA